MSRNRGLRRRIVGSSTLINRSSGRSSRGGSSSSSNGVRIERGVIGTPGGLVKTMGTRRGSSMMRGGLDGRHAMMHGRRRGRMVRMRMRMRMSRLVERMVVRAGIGRQRFGFLFREDIHLGGCLVKKKRKRKRKRTWWCAMRERVVVVVVPAIPEDCCPNKQLPLGDRFHY